MINSHNSPERSIMKPLKTLKMLWFPALCKCILPGLCISSLPMGLTASRGPEPQRQLALTRMRSLPKVFFQNSPCMYNIIYIYMTKRRCLNNCSHILTLREFSVIESSEQFQWESQMQVEVRCRQILGLRKLDVGRSVFSILLSCL